LTFLQSSSPHVLDSVPDVEVEVFNDVDAFNTTRMLVVVWWMVDRLFDRVWLVLWWVGHLVHELFRVMSE